MTSDETDGNELDFSNYKAYKCRYRACQADCINPINSLPARKQVCRVCLTNPPEHVAPTTSTTSTTPTADD